MLHDGRWFDPPSDSLQNADKPTLQLYWEYVYVALPPARLSIVEWREVQVANLDVIEEPIHGQLT
jgi:hypothetical protein